MNNVKRQELGNELQSSQHLHLQSVSHRLLDIATVPARAGEVQFKKSIVSIHAGREAHLGPDALVRAGWPVLAEPLVRVSTGKLSGLAELRSARRVGAPAPTWFS